MKDIERFIEKEKQIDELQCRLIEEFITLRKNAHMTQQQLADETNVIRTTIARIESNMNTPQIDTLLKLLEPLGYTLKIVPIDDTNEKN